MVARGENCFTILHLEYVVIFQVLPHLDLMSFAAHHSSAGEPGERHHPHTVEEQREARRRGDLPGVTEGTLRSQTLLTTAQ